MPRHTVRGPYPGGQVRGPEACRVVVVGKRVTSPVANARVDTNYWLQSDGQGSTWPPPARHPRLTPLKRVCHMG